MSREIIDQEKKRNFRFPTITEFFAFVGLPISLLAYVLTAPEIEQIETHSKFEVVEIATARNRPTYDSRPIANIGIGSRVKILESENEWVRIEISNSHRGWIEKSNGEIIDPPPPSVTSRQNAKLILLSTIDQIRDLF